MLEMLSRFNSVVTAMGSFDSARLHLAALRMTRGFESDSCDVLLSFAVTRENSHCAVTSKFMVLEFCPPVRTNT